MDMLASLIAKRAQLLAELEQLNESIRSAETGAPVRVETRRNLRNSPYLTTSVENALNMVLVFIDENLSVVANAADHGGWITPDDAAWLQAEGVVDGDLIRIR